MPRKPSFTIVVGTSTKSADAAAKDAERKAKKAGGEQISIAATTVWGGGGTSGPRDPILDNIAANLAGLLKCECSGEEKGSLRVPPIPPPGPLATTTTPGFVTWIVYVLIKK